MDNKFFYWVYKIQKIFKNKSPNIHYGEFGEDIFINRLLNNIKKGFYVDIGAYHPYKGSLTVLLHKRGWAGLNVDLSKTSIDLFNISRPNDINFNCAVSNYDGKTFFFQNSKINQQNSLIQKSIKQTKIEIESFKLETLINRFNINKIDYLNIDTEGNEFDVLSSLNIEKNRPLLITVENNSFDKFNDEKLKVIKFLDDNNYDLINTIGVTMFFYPKDKIKMIYESIKI